MSVMYGAILGLVQGIAEFLPISSSGHLVIVGALLSQYSGAELPAESATMNVALHCGTLVAILIVYRQDLWELRLNPRLMALIILATIPVGAVGLILKDQVEALFNEPLYAGCALLVTAAMLVASRQLQRPQSETREVSVTAAIVIGLFQSVAIIPGISRSGSTIAAGLMCGLSRTEATRFSFLIAIPAIGGATLVKSRDFLTGEAAIQTDLLAVAVGTVISMVVGVFALRWLIRIVVADRLHWFAVYCAAAGVATIIWQMLG
jgi:undecaprenyl-diphosphatase